MHISTFDLINNFEKRDYDFFDDKLTVNVKSIKVDAETEIKYDKIKVIQYQKRAELGWIWYTFILLGILILVNDVAGYHTWHHPTILLIEKAVVVCGLLFSIPSFHKREYCSFLDSDRNYLASIIVNKQNRGTLSEIINLVKKKAKITSEISPQHPFADTKPTFQLIQFEIPDFFNRSVARFYEDRVIDQEKSLVEEQVTEIKYSELSGKTQVVKIGDERWGYIWSYWLVFIIFAMAITTVFFPGLPKGVYIGLGAGMGLLVPPYFLRFIKRKTLLFYNNNDQVIYWTRLNSADQPKLDQIVEFIQGKVTRNKKTRKSLLRDKNEKD
jgi:hypothetical protein